MKKDRKNLRWATHGRGGGSEGGVDTAHARWGLPKASGCTSSTAGARTPASAIRRGAHGGHQEKRR